MGRMAAITVRGARESDYETIALLFPELESGDPVPSRALFALEMPFTLVAERDGRAVGYAVFRPLSDILHVSQMVTAPSARRTGVARAMMKAVVAEARKAECAFIGLNVIASNVVAIALYASLGFSFAYPARALEVPWSIADGAFEHPARAIEPADHARLERAAQIPAGLLAARSVGPGRVARRLETSDGHALGVFDPERPGVPLFRATDLAHARALFRDFRTHAHRTDGTFRLFVENQPDLADALVAAGASTSLDIRHMQAIVAPAPSIR